MLCKWECPAQKPAVIMNMSHLSHRAGTTQTWKVRALHPDLLGSRASQREPRTPLGALLLSLLIRCSAMETDQPEFPFCFSPSSCVTLSKALLISVPRFPHLYSHDRSVYPRGRLWELRGRARLQALKALTRVVVCLLLLLLVLRPLPFLCAHFCHFLGASLVFPVAGQIPGAWA